MPTIENIPPALLDQARKDEFKEWVRSMPAPRWARRELIHAFAKATNTRFQPSDYHYMLSHGDHPHER